MKLVRYGEMGHERAGLVDADGHVRDLSGVVAEIAGAALSPQSLRELAQLDARGGLPIIRTPVRLGACVGQIGKIICVGLNYHEHVREVGATVPAEPVLFMKATSALSGPFDDVIIPPGADALDWEVELGIVIGSRASWVSPEQALSHVAGYCIVNDLSERDWQMKGSGQWVKGKSADTFAPIGPWLVTREEVADPQSLPLQLSLNGELQQKGNTSDMVFGVSQIISYISRFMTLLPGDLISTGTPPGVGMGKRPPRYLRAGDVLELSVAGLGTQRQRLISALG
jgi:2-keto-4-pentenoate hydratase/2-oxohepta-3-ene-1,7-dioic acid hydratase in catechol pathway